MKSLATPLTIVCLLFLVPSTRAQLPAARLSAVFPPGGQQGTSVQVTVSGADLDELTALRFSTPVISASPKLDLATGKPVPNAFVVTIGKDARPGSYDVCAVGRFGVSNPRAFVVDREPHAAAAAGNTSRETATEIALNSGVYATAAATSAQFFRINLKAGQRAFIDVDSWAIDSKLDPVVVLYDSAGRELARDGKAGSIDFTPSSDGAYFIEVHDVLYRGGPEFFYRLRVRHGPRVDFVLPPAVRPDELAELTLLGRNLPGASAAPPLERLALRLQDSDDTDDLAGLRHRWLVAPAAAMLDGTQRYTFAGAVNPLFLARAAAPPAAEQSENDQPAKAQKLAVPVELYGQFFPRGDHDWISFDAKKGEAFWIEVVSHRLLGFTDPMLVVQRVTRDAQGNEQAADVKEAYEPENVPGMPREFYAAHRDPAFRFTAPEDGTYRVLVRDLFNEGSDDPRRVYRLSIAPAAQREDFRLVAWPQPPQPFNMSPPITQSWGSNLRPGGTMPVTVLAFRTGGFAGDITLRAEGLPAGVTCPPVVMNGNTNMATLMLVADEKAPPFVGPIRIVGIAGTGNTTVVRSARPGTVVWTVPNQELEPLRSRLAQEFVIAVTAGEAEPIAVRPAEEKVWENSVAGRIEIPLKLTRRMGFDRAVKLKPAGAAPKVLALPEFEIAAGAVEGKLVLDIGALELLVGHHSVYLQATSVGVYDRYPAQLAAANAAKAAADAATPQLAAAVQKATEAVAAAKVTNNAEAIAAAEMVLAEANEKVKQNEQAKAAAAEQIKALAQKEVTAYGYSTPINLKITPAPVTLALPAESLAIKPGAKVDVPVTITRLYGFADAVDLAITAPQGVTGLSAANVAIAKDAAQAVVAIQAAPQAKPGDYTLTLTATLKQNDRPIKLEQPLRVTISPP